MTNKINSNGINFNHTTEEIIITRRFEKAATVYNSAAYNTLVAYRKDFPTYKVRVKEIKKNKNKVSYKGLSIEIMKDFIERTNPDNLSTFDKVVRIASKRQGKYALIKKWFLENYKEAYTKEIENCKLEEELDSLEAELDNEIYSDEENAA